MSNLPGICVRTMHGRLVHVFQTDRNGEYRILDATTGRPAYIEVRGIKFALFSKAEVLQWTSPAGEVVA